MKRWTTLAACCALVWLAGGLARGETTTMHKYFGKSAPYISAPYWKVPDLTELAKPKLNLGADLTKAHEFKSVRAAVEASAGQKPITDNTYVKSYPVTYPRVYTDKTAAVNRMERQERVSQTHISRGPSSTWSTVRNPSVDQFRRGMQYPNAMNRYMQSSSVNARYGK